MEQQWGHGDSKKLERRFYKIYLVPLEVSKAENRSRNFIEVSSRSVINWGLAPRMGKE